jgi:WD40 repeat protein
VLVLPKSRVPVWQAAWQAQLEDHIISLAWSPDGQWDAAAVVSGPIKIFYAKDGALVCPLKGHYSGTSKVGWSADGKRFASAGQDGKTKFWDLINGRVLRSMDGGAAWVEVIAWNAGHGSAAVLASAAGRKIRLWNSEGVLLRGYRDHASTISAIQWVPASAQAKPLLVSAGLRSADFLGS